MEPPRTEVRLGVVLYGGVSLCIYMFGVARELWRLVRASEGAERNAYRDALDAANASATVDIVSGASAGGINGILLAKALANGAALDRARDLWLDAGDFDELLQLRSEREPRSLLRSEYFRGELERGLALMDGGGTGTPLVPVLDLFIATTRLRGNRREYIDWLGNAIHAREYRRSFRLRFRRRYALGTGEAGYDQNDFASAADARLTKLSRTTSAFPAAFEPTLIDAADALLEPPVDEPEGWFADGGILHNRPFTETISTIFTRTAESPVRRWLLSVDPDPERSEERTGAGPRPDFIEVLRKAAGELPRYQSITADLDRLGEHNDRVARFRAMLLELEADLARRYPSAPDPERLERDRRAQTASAPYALLRRKAAAVDLTETIVSSSGLAPDAGPQGADPAGAVESAVLAFLDERPDAPDLAFHLRRAYYMIEVVRIAATAAASPERVAEYSALRGRLWEQHARLSALRWDLIRPAMQGLAAAPPEQLYEHVRVTLGAVAPRLGAALAEIEADTAAACAGVTLALPEGLEKGAPIAAEPALETVFASYVMRDLFLLPLDVLGLGERDAVKHIRIAPSAATNIGKPPGDKLAGDALGHFGGFLDRAWRENDMLWGRLDAAEVLTRLVLEDRAPDEVARHVDAVQREIVAEDLPVALAHPAGWKAYLVDEHRLGAQDVGDLPRRRVGRLAYDSMRVFRSMLRTVERAQPDTGLGRVERVVTRWVGRGLGLALALARLPIRFLR